MVVLPPARIGTARIKGKETAGQQTDTDQRGIPMVTLRPCRQASMLFTSTLAAHLKIGSDEPARTEKVQSINWATEAGVLQLDFSQKKRKKSKPSLHLSSEQPWREKHHYSEFSCICLCSSAWYCTYHMHIFFCPVHSGRLQLSCAEQVGHAEQVQRTRPPETLE